MIMSLGIATILRTFLVIISYGCKVPAGIFVPSMAIGASFGRMVGIFVQYLQESFPSSAFFSACEPDGPCITPGTYAFLGAAAALSGIMHITVSVVVIMFELTGALTYILPTMVCSRNNPTTLLFTEYIQIVVGVTKAVSERFGHGGIADRAIWFNGYPFLDNKEEHTFNVPVSQVMAKHVVSLPATGLEIRAIERIMSENQYQGYPIVEDSTSKILIGYIGRTELRYAIDRAKRHQQAPGHAKVSFISPTSGRNADSHIPSSRMPAGASFETISATSQTLNVDLHKFIDPTPLSVHPRLALETVMELFKKMGPRVILIEYRGRLTGLVTVKDCLKYQFKVEAQDHPQQAGSWDDRMEVVWGLIKSVAVWVDGKLAVIRSVLGLRGSGDIRLVSPMSPGMRGGERRSVESDEGPGVELEDRPGMDT
jgi:chloride channel 3/4/5